MTVEEKQALNDKKKNEKRVDQYIRVLTFIKVEDMLKLRGSFLQLSDNAKPLSELVKISDLCDIYLTQDSLLNNFPKVFGYRSDTLALRFYNILANGFNGVHVYFPTFLVKLIGLIDGFPMQLNLFGFKMLDSSQTGMVYTTDIADMT